MSDLAIHWFRRDLRLTDNSALHHASRSFTNIVPVYILTRWKEHHHWTGAARQEFLCGNLASLSKNLDTIGSRLVVRCGDPVSELERLIKETKSLAVYTNRAPDPFGRAEEARVASMCASLGVEFRTFKDCVLHEPDEALTGDGRPYRVYTPYSRTWLSLPKPEPLPKVKSLGARFNGESLELPTIQHWNLRPSPTKTPPPGERAARDRMNRFIESGALALYGEMRNIPFGDHTSRLSPDLRYGLIGIRELYQRCQQHADATRGSKLKASVATYIKELAWREFYMAVLHHWPEVLETDFNAEFRNVPWESPEDHFEAWKQGRTGFPIVDAGMRQLLATGWMHNRVRMIVAMFLTKDLHTHWRLGESFFMQHLVDGEIASNNGGWQWSAGTGADAAPYFRIQNPWLQSKRYDPDGAYIRQWVPELAKVSAVHFAAPPERPLAPDYPLPIVDHHAERDRTLARFKQARTR